MRMRLFVAVDLPHAEVEALDAGVGARSAGLRWVPPEQWHITLVFCGEVEERVVPELRTRLARAAGRTPALSLRLTGAGTFPRQAAKARVLWVGLDGEVRELSRLAERCAAAARRCGIAIEDRPFRPHLTLARARRDAVDAREELARLSSYAGTSWPVRNIRLVHSTLGGRVHHQTLDTFVLAPAAHQA